MPTKSPRLNVVLEAPVLFCVRLLARREGVSLSMKARDLIREALELYEDSYFAKRADERAATFVRSKALTHEQVLSHLKIKPKHR